MPGAKLRFQAARREAGGGDAIKGQPAVVKELRKKAAARPTIVRENSCVKRWTTWKRLLQLVCCTPALIWTLSYTRVGCGMCSAWARVDNMTVGTAWLDGVPPCPCNVNDALVEKHQWTEDPVPQLHQPCSTHPNTLGCTQWSLRSVPAQQPGASKEGGRNSGAGVVSTAGNQCCYGQDGNLLTTGLSAGTADRFSPDPYRPYLVVMHMLVDVLPFLTCCHLCHRECEACSTYIRLRPLVADPAGCKHNPSADWCH